MQSQETISSIDESHRSLLVVSATWENTRNQIKPLSRSDVFQSVPSDSTLACPLCSKLLRSAVQSPCCSTRYCEECIQNHLLEHDFSCPECEKRIADLTTLKRDDETRKKVESYVEEAVGKSEEEVKEREESEAKAKAEREESERKIKEEEEEAATTTANGQPTGEESASGLSKEAEAGQAGALSANGTPPAGTPNMPSNVPVVMFNPQLVQQLVMTLSNPRLPPPMRMMLQTQLQAQQMAFIRMQSNGGAGGAPGGPGAGMNSGMGGMPGAGAGWQGQQGFRPMGMQQQQQQQQMNPMMGMNGTNGMGGMRMGMNNPAAAMGMGMGVGVGMGMMNRPGMTPGVGPAAAGGGGPMDGGAYNRARK